MPGVKLIPTNLLMKPKYDLVCVISSPICVVEVQCSTSESFEHNTRSVHIVVSQSYAKPLHVVGRGGARD